MLTYDLDRTHPVSLYDQLYRCIRTDIESGALRPGERLPSKRALARHLGVSLITVQGALAQLVAEGYVDAQERRGCFVAFIERSTRAPRQPAPPCAQAASHATPPAPVRPPMHAEPPALADLTGASTPGGLFPYHAWASIVRKVLAEGSEDALIGAGEPQGSPLLREAIAKHVRGFRGLDVEPGRIVVGAGAQVLYQLIVQLLGPRMRVAVEDPGYPRLQRTYEAMGAQTQPIPVIGEAASLEWLAALEADAIHCMPSHHFPTGATISAPARHRLLEWAHAAEGRYLVEDDYDCEFRMQGKPIAPLCALDDEKVIYLNTYTKSLGGAFRIGYMVLPAHLAHAFRERLGFYSCTVGGIDQAALRRFIATGAYERHCNRLRTHYRRVSRALALGLKGCAEGVRLRHVGAGLHFAMKVNGMQDEEQEGAFLRGLEARGVRMNPLRAYRYEGCPRMACELAGTFLVSFGGVEEECVARIVRAVGEALEGARGGAPYSGS